MDDSGLEITGYLSLAHRILELGNLLDNTEIMAFGYLELSRGTLMLKKYDLCLQYVYKAIDLSQELDHDEQVADAQRIAGAAYLALNNTELAYSYLDKAYQYYLSANDTTKRLQTLSEMAIMYSYEQQYEKCIDLYNDVLYLSGKQKWQSMQLVTLLNMARTYTNAGETDLALNTLDRIRHGIPDSLFNEVYRMAYLLNRGELLLSKGRVQEPKKTCKTGSKWQKPPETWMPSSPASEAVYEIFDIQGRLYARGESSSSLYEIPVSQKGIYIVRFYTDKGIGLKKLLVM